MTIANVNLSSTFEQWRSITNQLVTRANDIDEGNLIRFVSNTSAIFISANAVRGNTIYISTNVATSANDTSTANLASAALANSLNEVIVLTTNRSISGYDTTNIAYAQANTARDTANDAYSKTNAGFSQANTARDLGNIVFAQANTARNVGNLAFLQGNSAANIALAAFAQANTANAAPPLIQANTARDQANIAFIQANTAYTQANLTLGRANTARDQANDAYTQSNTSFGQANIAYNQANTALGRANIAYDQANLSLGRANTAYDHANLVLGRANTARDQGNTAFTQANTVFGTANLAFAVAANASITANLGFLQANSAWGNATNAVLYTVGSPTVVDSNVVVFNGTTGRLIKDSLKTLPSGAIVGTTDTQTLTNKTLQGSRDVRVALADGVGTFDINLSLGNYFTKTVSGATTFRTTSNVASGGVSSFILEMTFTAGPYSVTFPSGTKWAGGAPPTWTNTGRDVAAFYTHDGGTTWNAILIGLDFK